MATDFLKIYKGLSLSPRSADPTSPLDGDVQFADGTARAKGLWQYKDGAWVLLSSPNVLSSSISAQVVGSTTADVYTDSGLALPLTVGLWDISINVPVYIRGGTGTGVSGRYISIQLVDASNVLIADINANNVQGNGCFVNAAAPIALSTCTISAKVNITSAETYKVRFTSKENSGVTTITEAIIRVNAAYASAYFTAREVG